jgi:molybdopterin-binding protein
MNRLEVEVTKIEEVDRLHYLTLSLNKKVIHMLTLELSKNIKVGKNVNISIKSTNIGISKTLKKDISIENQLKSKVIHIENGKILSSICLNIEGFKLESIISLDACKRLNLKVDDEVFALLSESAVSIVG